MICLFLEFAALQTTVSDLTEELEGGSILFRDYDVYASKVLFADSSHPVLAPPVIMVKHMCPTVVPTKSDSDVVFNLSGRDL